MHFGKLNFYNGRLQYIDSNYRNNYLQYFSSSVHYWIFLICIYNNISIPFVRKRPDAILNCRVEWLLQLLFHSLDMYRPQQVRMEITYCFILFEQYKNNQSALVGNLYDGNPALLVDLVVIVCGQMLFVHFKLSKFYVHIHLLCMFCEPYGS